MAQCVRATIDLQQVSVSFSETIFDLKLRVASFYKAKVGELMFHFREEPSIFIPDQQKVGCFQLLLCATAPCICVPPSFIPLNAYRREIWIDLGL